MLLSPYFPERFHRSLKAEALGGPPFDSLDQAARHLDQWRHVYNTERPHEALGMGVPVDRYAISPRPYQPVIAPFDYAPDDQLRSVPNAGSHISFKGRPWRVPKAFKGKIVAIRPTNTEGLYDVVFRTNQIAAIDLRT